MRTVRHLLPTLLLFALTASSVSAQDPAGVEQGIKPYGSYQGGDIDSISMVNRLINLRIPLISYPQRGGNLHVGFSVHFQDPYYSPWDNCPPPPKLCTSNNTAGYYLWYGPAGGSQAISIVPDFIFSVSKNGGFGTPITYTVSGPDGATHRLEPISASNYLSTDTTGFNWNNTTALLTDRQGTRYSMRLVNGYPADVSNIEDTNGNILTTNYGTIPSTGATYIQSWTDTLGRTLPAPLAYNAVTTTDYTGCSGTQPTTSATLWTPPGQNGGTSQFKVCYAAFPINFQPPDCTGICIPTGGTTTQIQSIVLPNGAAWTFELDTNGALSKIGFPTGGSISYTSTWQKTGNTQGHDLLFPYNRPTVTRAMDANDGTGPHTWTYSQTAPNNPTTVTDPLGNDAVHIMSNSTLSGYEVELDQYQGSQTSGTLLRKTTTVYNSTVDPYSGPVMNVAPTSITITDQTSGKTTQVTKSYDSGIPLVPTGGQNANVIYGDVLSQSNYDYGSGSPGSLLKTTNATYAALSGPNASSYLANNLLSLPYTIQVQNSSGAQMAYTFYGYDEYSLANAGAVTTQHDSNPPDGASRGNLTSVHRWLNGSTTATTNCTISVSNGYLVNFAVYNDTGTIDHAVDSCGTSASDSNHKTTYAYSLTYAGAFPTTVTNPLNQSASRTFDFNTGLLTSTTDPNNATSSFSYDSMWRLSQVNHPAGGQDGITHQESTFPSTATLTTKINSSQNRVKTNLFDGLGRVSQTQLCEDGSPCTKVIYTATTYDPLERISSVYNPTRCNPPTANCGEPTWGYTTLVYDALGRECVLVPPDGTAVPNNTCPSSQPANDIFTTYSGTCTTITDQAGKARESCIDGLGRLTQVFEDPGSSPHQNLETDYAYDALDNLLTVNQKGGSTSSSNWRTRTFTYDSLSHLTSSVNPESNTQPISPFAVVPTTYTYDADGNVSGKTSPAPNQQGTATTTVSYCYDVLNRMTAKAYTAQSCPMSSPVATLTYDAASLDGHTITNPVGRLVKAATSDGLTGDWTSYDPMARTATQWECTPLNCGNSTIQLGYTYDLAGGETSFIFNGGGYTISQSRDAAERATGLTSTVVDQNHPATLATVDSSIGYYPQGAVRKVTFGNGLTQTAAYNNRLQPCRFNSNTSATALGTCADAVPSGNVLDFNYNFNLGSSDNGNVASWAATGQQAFNRTFSYDPLNRISTMNQSSGNATGCSSTFSLSWTIDPWGNRTDQTVTGGTCNAFHAPVNTQNQFSQPPYQYDTAGNMTADGNHTYFYDAENHLSQVDGSANYCSTHSGTPATACYVYDALGRRAEKKVGTHPTDYIYDASGNVSNELNNVCAPVCIDTDYLYLDGQLVAEYKEGLTYFVHGDHLGSTRLVTAYPWVNQTQSVVQNLDYLPFGELNSSDSGISAHKFTAKERDGESGLDNFGARYNGSNLGRFMSPDPLAGHTVDPQTLNRYAYVRNNPLNLTDPTGLDFYLSCQQQSNTCGRDAAGNLVQGTTTTTTDANGNAASTFTPTVVTSASLQDPNSGNTAVINANGVQITTTDANGNQSTAEGIFINGTPSATIQGDPKAAGWSDFVFNINGSDEKKGTLTSGSATYKWSRDQADVIAALNKMGAFSYIPEQVLGNYHHPGDLNFRFSSGAHPNLFDYGPSPHFTLPQDPEATVPVGPGYATGFHVDSHTGPRHSACAEKGWGCTN